MTQCDCIVQKDYFGSYEICILIFFFKLPCQNVLNRGIWTDKLGETKGHSNKIGLAPKSVRAVLITTEDRRAIRLMQGQGDEKPF
jgi:hypothetical protein